MRPRLFILFVFIGFVVLMAMKPGPDHSAGKFHTAGQISMLQQIITVPIDSNEYFLPPFTCQGCHGFDSTHSANIDIDSNDVNLYDDWQTSMMGMSAIDPFWRAKVSQEILTNPGHADELQTLCTKCHAPMGHFTSKFHGDTIFTMDQLETDTLGLAGVGCGACHSLADDSIFGLEFTGNLHYDTNHIEYGPFTNPMLGPMQLYVGIEPAYSPHISRSQVCGGCHTLISNSVDLAGNPTGSTFVEQSTYHEWLNSVYPFQEKVCQTCHMPKLEDPVKIANGIALLPGRSPFNLHQFTGANEMMINLIKNNKDSLNYDAPDFNFDSSLVLTRRMLETQTLKLKVDTEAVSADTAYFSVTLENMAGHKFPSGYPSRRAVLQFTVLKENGDTLFASGMFGPDHDVAGLAAPFETHHQVISDQARTQVYEMVMLDVNGDKTTILERAHTKIKDNRIPPAGFTTAHSVYDTCFIAGTAQTDPDFNKIDAAEGTGKDIVHFHVALNGYKGTLKAVSAVKYQTIPPAWLDEMRTLSSVPIDRFLTMFDAESNAPKHIASDSIQQIPVPDFIRKFSSNAHIFVSPNPFSSGEAAIYGLEGWMLVDIQVLDGSGKTVATFKGRPSGGIIRFKPSLPGGMYYIVGKNENKTFLLKFLII